MARELVKVLVLPTAPHIGGGLGVAVYDEGEQHMVVLEVTRRHRQSPNPSHPDTVVASIEVNRESLKKLAELV
jgi:hypothetical protein